MLKSVIVAMSLCAAGGAFAQPAAYLYEFEIRVVENQIISNNVGGDLAQLTVGSVGTVSYLVDTDPDALPGNNTDESVSYSMQDVGFSMNGLEAGARPGTYPSSNIFEAFTVQNDGLATGGRLLDVITVIPIFDHPAFGLSVMSLGQYGTPADPPTFLSGVDLPLSMDVSLADGTDFSINSPLNATSRVFFEVDAFTVTPIPSASSFAVLGIGGLLTARRRR